jgi:hypothetical protein
MKLMIVDFAHYPISFETEQFLKMTTAGHKIIVYVADKDLYQGFWFYDLLKTYDQESFEKDQIDSDAVYASNSSYAEKVGFKIPYFYSIYANTWKNDNNYEFFQKTYSKIKGASAVFVNDKKLNRFSNWLGLNSYFLNKPVNINRFKFIERKFLTPKLNIGFIPSSKIFDENNPRNKIVEDMWVSAKSNWTLHIPNNNNLDVSKNIVKHRVVNVNSVLDYRPIYEQSHIIINPENIYSDSLDFCHEDYSFEAMSTGCISIHPNLHGNNNHVMFDKFHYFKLDFIDSNTLLEIIRYVNKRRTKLYNMSKSARDLIEKYYNVDTIVKEKIRIMEKYI